MPMNKKTVIVPVQFAVAVECEYTDDGILVGTTSSFHPVCGSSNGSQRPGEEDPWDACLESPPFKKDGTEYEDWPDYQNEARLRLSMELGRPIFWDAEEAQDDEGE